MPERSDTMKKKDTQSMLKDSIFRDEQPILTFSIVQRVYSMLKGSMFGNDLAMLEGSMFGNDLAMLEFLYDPESAWFIRKTWLSEADLLQLTNEYWQMLASMQHDMGTAISQPEIELFPGPTAIFPPDLSSTRIESDFCSSIVTVQRMSPLRLFKIRWNLEPLISPSL